MYPVRREALFVVSGNMYWLVLDWVIRNSLSVDGQPRESNESSGKGPNSQQGEAYPPIQKLISFLLGSNWIFDLARRSR